MQKSKSRGDMKKWLDARRVFPGFPAKPFERLEDIEAYVSGERLPCLLCGQQFKRPLVHVKRIHQIDEREYRERFNIPARFPICSPEVSEFRKALGYRLLDEGHTAKMWAADCRPTKRRQGTMVTTFSKDSWRQNFEGVNFSKPKVGSDCSWHIAQVGRSFAYADIEPPEGELSWSGYKKRRMKDAELNGRHRAARAARLMAKTEGAAA